MRRLRGSIICGILGTLFVCMGGSAYAVSFYGVNGDHGNYTDSQVFTTQSDNNIYAYTGNGWIFFSATVTGSPGNVTSIKVVEQGSSPKSSSINTITTGVNNFNFVNFSLTLSGSLYKAGPKPGSMPGYNLTATRDSTTYFLEADIQIIPIGSDVATITAKETSASFTGNKSSTWAISPNSYINASGNTVNITMPQSSATATVGRGIPAGIYTVTAQPSPVAETAVRKTMDITVVEVASVSATYDDETITSTTDSPSTDETIYVQQGDDAFDITATSNPSDVWPDGKPTWTINGTSGGTNGTDTYSFDPENTGIYTVAANCGNAKALKLVVIDIKLASVDFQGTGNHVIKKQGSGDWTDNKYVDDGNVTINYPEWQDTNQDDTPEVNEPVAYTMGSTPKMTAVFSVSPNLPSSIPAKLKVTNGSNTLIDTEVSLSGTGLTVSDLDWNTSLPSCVKNIRYTLNWSISFNGGTTYLDIGSSETKFFVTYGTPQGSSVTAKRLNWCTALAKDKSTLAQIGDAIGPDAVSGARFSGAKSIFGDNPIAVWSIMDGTRADCGSLSTLMKCELDMLGATGAEVRFVYPRHASWNGLSRTSPPSDSYSEYNDDGQQLGIWVGSGLGAGWNNYEGCCVFQSKWWKGGFGTSASSAYQVLLDLSSPNTSGATVSHQCWLNDTATAVSYPDGTP